jgi:predicted nuclease with TOPRIM domain
MTDVETGKGKIKTLNEQLKLNITEKEKINKKIKD